MRRPPSRENLLAEAQPAISEPSTPTPMTASTKKMPASTTWPTAPSPGPMGMASRTRRYGRRATAGASWKIRRSAPAGTMSSFCANFTPSATSWAQPWKPPAYIGPRRPCMWAITLCSVWPTTRGKTRKTTKTTTSRRATSRASFTACLLRGRRRRVGSGLPSGSGSGRRRGSVAVRRPVASDPASSGRRLRGRRAASPSRVGAGGPRSEPVGRASSGLGRCQGASPSGTGRRAEVAAAPKRRSGCRPSRRRAAVGLGAASGRRGLGGAAGPVGLRPSAVRPAGVPGAPGAGRVPGAAVGAGGVAGRRPAARRPAAPARARGGSRRPPPTRRAGSRAGCGGRTAGSGGVGAGRRGRRRGASAGASAGAGRPRPPPAAAAWPAEPSPAVRVRRAGRSPAARGRAPGRAGRGGRELALQRAPLVRVGDARRQHLAALRARRARTRPAPWRRATPWRPGPRGRSPCAAGGPRSRRGAGAGPGRVALEVDAEHLVGLALVPAGARVHVDGGGQDGGLVRDGRAQRAAGVPGTRATTCAQTRKPVPGSSTALSQSK